MSVLIVIPTLGQRPRLLRRSIRSVASQNIPGLDIVTVAPPGRGVEALAAEFGARFVEEPSGSRGLSSALNAGLAAARPDTKYFSWLGDDDILAPGSLITTCNAMDHSADAVMVYGWCDYIDENDNVVFRSRAGRIASMILRWGPNLIPQPGCLFRYADVVAVGGLDEDVRLAMDLDLFLRLRERGRFVAIPQTLACFRWHADSATVRGENASMEESDRLRMKYMTPTVASLYEYLRWPGRAALWLAKRRVDHNTSRVAGQQAG